jgi:phage terminase large subunit-like protein
MAAQREYIEAELRAAEQALLVEQEALIAAFKFRRKDFLFPEEGPLSRHAYADTVAFLNATAQYKECVAFGGNRTGKTEGGAYAVSTWATGEYPEWWEGRRFSGPTSGVVAGKDSKTVRDTIQHKLLGFPGGEIGSGMIPRDRLILSKCKKASGTPDLYDIVMVRHVSGGESLINIKSYDMGRQAFEGTARHYGWEDEEAPLPIHRENVQRTMDHSGVVINTYTPLLGQTQLTRDLRKRSKGETPTVFMVTLTWDNVPHITSAMIAAYEGIYDAHEMKARRFGIPKLGSGAVFTTDFDTVIGVKPFKIPNYWPRGYGMDFGWSPHPTAAVWGAWDRESDIVYLYSEHRMGRELPSVHAEAIKMRGEWIHGNSETAGTNLADGQRMIQIYRGLGLHLHPANKGVESNIYNMRQRIETGGLRVFTTLVNWREEYEGYHRKEGKIVKEVDDELDSTMYLLSDMSVFRTKPVKRRAANVRQPRFGDYVV